MITGGDIAEFQLTSLMVKLKEVIEELHQEVTLAPENLNVITFPYKSHVVMNIIKWTQSAHLWYRV